MFKIKTKRIISVFIIVIIILSMFILSSCGEDNWIPAGMKLASTDAVDYTLYVPESWIIDISTGMVSAYASNTDRSNITMMAFNLENENVNLNVDEYWEKHEEELKSTFPDFSYDIEKAPGETSENQEETSAEQNETAEPIKITLDGIAANKYTYSLTVTGVKYNFIQVIAIRAAIVYIFTYTAIPEQFDKHAEDINSILEYFKYNK